MISKHICLFVTARGGRGARGSRGGRGRGGPRGRGRGRR